jgi:hypothetical protein
MVFLSTKSGNSRSENLDREDEDVLLIKGYGTLKSRIIELLIKNLR